MEKIVLVLIVAVRSTLGLWGKNWMWLRDIELAIGLVIGYLLADIEGWFYALICNPNELACQRLKSAIASRNWSQVYILTKSIGLEKERLPVRNVLTGMVIALVGIWMVYSVGSQLGIGVVVGLGWRLWAELVKDKNWKRWYWLFAREFSEHQHKIVVAVWLIGLVIQSIKIL